MCRKANNVLGHVYLLFWQCICALPAVVLFSGGDRYKNAPNGIAFFIIVVAVAVYGTLMICSRTCCDCCTEVRWLFNFFVILYVLLQLGLMAWSGYFSYIFLDPFFYSDGFTEWYNEVYLPKWLALHPTAVAPTSSALQTYYIVGATASLLIILFCFFVIASAIHTMMEGPKKKKNVDHDEEKEPFIPKSDDAAQQQQQQPPPQTIIIQNETVGAKPDGLGGSVKIPKTAESSESLTSGLERS